ncbi:MAG: division/cell wall cluster transcriptional repressor MraZ [Patescibacteria group bacterium]
MLLGEYTHTIDEKGRMSVPSKFRKEFGKKMIVTHGLDNCLFAFSEKNWQKFSNELSKLSFANSDNRKFTRFILGGAIEAEVDGAGRILLPDFLRKFAGLSGKAVFAGVHDRAEIWSEETWVAYKKGVEKNVDLLAERLGEMGVSL